MKNESSLLFTVCARAGSKGVKGKNTKIFCGKPLAAYTLAAYELFRKRYQSAYGEMTLAVNTDSELLVQQMDRMQTAYVYIPRAEELAGDTVSKKDVIRDTLIKCEEKTKKVYDVVIDLDLTSPLRTAGDIRGTLETLLQDAGADIAYSVTSSRRSPYFNMVAEGDDGYFHTVMQTGFTTRQQCPVCYDMNASIYAYRRAYTLSERVLPRNEVVWQMKDTGILDIDSEDDFELMEVLAEYFYRKYPAYGEIKAAADRG
ncbi:MAG: acylneuraminate cytidylyltransferase family protein [Bacteroidales bacterium]|nr:acylneuraminate cytidylyltransferase family protein [Bacteroidales bacterium]MCM1414541.1 acylneuraminate cytidylyltransferase family protein [bacterium]MCM1422591.1 acylneuraminate cytidylyltransferase family protein [bacterium]